MNVALSAGAQGLLYDVERILLAEEDYFGIGRELSYLSGGFDPIQCGKSDIKQN
jgi:hypothetical protein